MKALVAIDNLKTSIESRVRVALPDDLSVKQWMFIVSVHLLDKPNLNSVCDHAALLSPSGSRILKLLQEADLVRCRPCIEDGRNNVLFLTAEGGRVYRKYRVRVKKALRVNLEDLNEVAAIISEDKD